MVTMLITTKGIQKHFGHSVKRLFKYKLAGGKNETTYDA
jgi:hypothetical protein